MNILKEKVISKDGNIIITIDMMKAFEGKPVNVQQMLKPFVSYLKL